MLLGLHLKDARVQPKMGTSDTARESLRRASIGPQTAYACPNSVQTGQDVTKIYPHQLRVIATMTTTGTAKEKTVKTCPYSIRQVQNVLSHDLNEIDL